MRLNEFFFFGVNVKILVISQIAQLQNLQDSIALLLDARTQQSVCPDRELSLVYLLSQSWVNVPEKKKNTFQSSNGLSCDMLLSAGKNLTESQLSQGNKILHGRSENKQNCCQNASGLCFRWSFYLCLKYLVHLQEGKHTRNVNQGQ